MIAGLEMVSTDWGEREVRSREDGSKKPTELTHDMVTILKEFCSSFRDLENALLKGAYTVVGSPHKQTGNYSIL